MNQKGVSYPDLKLPVPQSRSESALSATSTQASHGCAAQRPGGALPAQCRWLALRQGTITAPGPPSQGRSRWRTRCAHAAASRPDSESVAGHWQAPLPPTRSCSANGGACSSVRMVCTACCVYWSSLRIARTCPRRPLRAASSISHAARSMHGCVLHIACVAGRGSLPVCET
jgi:hypothetical protein